MVLEYVYTRQSGLRRWKTGQPCSDLLWLYTQPWLALLFLPSGHPPPTFQPHHFHQEASCPGKWNEASLSVRSHGPTVVFGRPVASTKIQQLNPLKLDVNGAASLYIAACSDHPGQTWDLSCQWTVSGGKNSLPGKESRLLQSWEISLPAQACSITGAPPTSW